MPATRTRARVQRASQSSLEEGATDSPAGYEHVMQVDVDQEVIDEAQDGEDEEFGLEDEPEIFPPPGLKEISSLASWTVSTAKPGNGVAALRSPDPAHFWQSDGPQPHLLSIHFFKLVSIASMEVMLDFENDESYTPTKIQFLAGMGVHDIQEFAEMSFEQPTGWHSVDFSNVGPIDDTDEDDEEAPNGIDWSKRPVLRAFLVQVRILENHQNGKDTHLRGVRIFARDEAQQPRKVVAKPLSATLPARLHAKAGPKHSESNNIKLAPWMSEPDLR